MDDDIKNFECNIKYFHDPCSPIFGLYAYYSVLPTEGQTMSPFDSTGMNFCRSTDVKSEFSTQQLSLLSVYLFLRLKGDIDKLLVRDLAVEMSLAHIIVYLEFDILKSSSPIRAQIWSNEFR